MRASRILLRGVSRCMSSASYNRSLSSSSSSQALQQQRCVISKACKEKGEEGECIPLREYIHQSLYGNRGYFTSHTNSNPILSAHNNNKRTQLSFRNRFAYENSLARLHASEEHGWLTPSEQYSPYLGFAVANRIARCFDNFANHNASISVFEIGAGRGTLARDVLCYMRSQYPRLLSRVVYNTIDISAALAAEQQCTLAQFIRAGTARVHVADARSWMETYARERRRREEEEESCVHTHVIALELFDNLPHDLVRVDSGGRVEQARVHGRYNAEDTEEEGRGVLEWTSEVDRETYAAGNAFRLLQPAHGGGISEAIYGMRVFFESFLNANRSNEVWVPVAAHQLLRAIFDAFPQTALTIADFDALPACMPGVNAPVVQRVCKGVASVYDNLLSAPFGKVDILFPTNFEQLANALPADRASVCIMSQKQFFEQYSHPHVIEQSTCQDGYRPIANEFRNTKWLLKDPA